ATPGTSTVAFNGTLATPTSWSATSITVPVPTGATTGNVVVTVGVLASNGVPSSVPTPAPSITSLTPTSAPAGTPVTIAGANFGATKGTSTIAFNGTLATPTAWSATSITVPVPTGATTGNVVVTVGGLTSNAVPFTVTAPALGVTVDAVGPSAAGASVSSGTTLSWSHTVSPTGSNLLLTVAVAVGRTPDTGLALSVTYNGVPMTSAGLVHSNNQNAGLVQMFYLPAPAPGAHTVQVTLSGGSADLEAGSVSFTGVDQTTPVRNIASRFGSG